LCRAALLFGLSLGLYAQKPQAVQLLEARCLGCHNAAGKQSGFDLSNRETALRGGDRGPGLVPGKAKESFLYQVLAHTAKPAMPKFGAKFSEAELALVAGWIDDGAPWEKVVSKGPKRSSHWAFNKPVRPAAASLDALVKTEAPEASAGVLLRRLHLDLVGMPPTPDETARHAKLSYEQTVDALLADPRYGERWGRHWMDIWRYSDWYGYRRSNEVRNSHKHMWRWRDWIVESLNSGKPYDRMIVEMLAGDEVAPDDPKTLRATGFLARNYSKFDRDGWMQDAVDHTMLGFMGVTVKCARCHDHKYDPIAQEEYYRLRAVFEPYEVRMDRVPGETDVEKDGLTRIFDAALDRPTYLLIRGNIQTPDKANVLTPATPAALGPALGKVDAVSLPLASYYPDHREFVHAELLAQAKDAITKAAGDPLALAAAQAELPALEARIAAERAKFAVPADPNFEELAAKARELERKAGILRGHEKLQKAQAEMTAALAGEKPDSKKVAEAQKNLAAATAALTQPATGYTPIGKEYPTKSSGRRTALAQWVGSTENPLTARVAVNHIWLRHFGTALVPTVFDFGLNGQKPTNQPLLDFLATEFMNSGWNMKALHKTILMSAAYKAVRPASRRLEAEVVRDSILAVAGELDRTMGGPDIDPAKGFEVRRRSLYFSHSPDMQMQFLQVFDGANPTECYERNESVVPQQALAMANSQLSQEMAAKLARRLEGPGFVDRAFQTVLGRLPASAERKLAAEAAPVDLIHALFNHNDFVTTR
jgi:hypothetical protein